MCGGGGGGKKTSQKKKNVFRSEEMQVREWISGLIWDFLEREPVEVNSLNVDGKTAIMLAAERGHVTIFSIYHTGYCQNPHCKIPWGGEVP